MVIFLGVCFLYGLWHCYNLKFAPSATKFVQFTYIAGVALLNIAILTLMTLVWAVENGHW